MVLRNSKCLFFLLSVFISCMKISNIGAADVCVKKSACSCENSEGTIDLTPLVGSPKFKDVKADSGKYHYSYNPCTAFTESGCAKVAGCQTDMTSNYYSIGTQDSAAFKVDATKGLYIEYVATTDVKRTLNVYLKCDQTEEGKLDVTGQNPPASAIYEMTLTSKYCCPNVTPTTSPGPSPVPCKHNHREWLIIIILSCIMLSLLVLIILSSILICLQIRNNRNKSFTSTNPNPNVSEKKSYGTLN